MNPVIKTALVALAATGLALGSVGCGSGKPSKEDVKAGLLKGFEASETGGTTPTEEVKPVLECVVDKVYDKVSVDTLKKMASGDSAKMTEEISTEDETALTEASSACAQELMAES